MDNFYPEIGRFPENSGSLLCFSQRLQQDCLQVTWPRTSGQEDAPSCPQSPTQAKGNLLENGVQANLAYEGFNTVLFYHR